MKIYNLHGYKIEYNFTPFSHQINDIEQNRLRIGSKFGLDSQGAFDLRKFPRDQRERFVTSVLRGKNQMPPWGDILKPEEVEALWGYVVAGEQ